MADQGARREFSPEAARTDSGSLLARAASWILNLELAGPLRVALVVAAFVFAVALNLWLPGFATKRPFIFFYIPVFTAALVSGTPAVFSVVLGADVLGTSWLAPWGSFQIEDVEDILSEVAFTVVSCVLAILLPSMRRVVRDLSIAAYDLRMLYEAMPCGVLAIDALGTPLQVNTAALTILQARREDLHGPVSWATKFLLLREDGSHLPEDYRPLDRALRTGVPQRDILARLALPNGDQRMLQVDAVPMPDEAGITRKVVMTFSDVTDRLAVQKRADRFGRILDHSSNEIYVLDADTLRFEHVNEGAQRNLGYGMDELRHLTPADLLVAPDAGQFTDLLAPLRSGEQEMVSREATHRRKDGSLYPIEARWQLTRTEDPPLFVGIVLDITERKRAEQRLRRAERALATLSDCNQVLVRVATEAELLERICRTIVEVGGYRLAWVSRAEQDEARTVHVIASFGADSGDVAQTEISWADPPQGHAPTGTAIRDGRLVIAPSLTPGGAGAPAAGVAIALPLWIDGRVFGALTLHADETYAFDDAEVRLLHELAEDIAFGLKAMADRSRRARAETALREAVEALRASEQHLRAVVSHAPILLFAFDRDGICNLLDGGALPLIGWQPREVVGHDFFSRLSDRPDLAGYARRALAGEAFVTETEIGDLVFEMWWTPDYDGMGALAGGSCVAVNITDQVRARQDAERARAASDELAKLRSDFVAAVSHELRTPLTAVVGYAELLQAFWSTMDDAQRLSRIERIVEAANRQKRLVEDLLTLTQLEAHSPSPIIAPVDLRLVVERAAREVQGAYPGQRIDEEGPPELRVLADQAKVLQILTNLIDNAAKYSPEGSPIQVSWGIEEGESVVRVSDNGPGIPEAGREQLFTRFGRIPGSRIRAGHVGTGLGLYLGRQLARAMGGDLDLNQTGPTGTSFSLRLPLADKE